MSRIKSSKALFRHFSLTLTPQTLQVDYEGEIAAHFKRALSVGVSLSCFSTLTHSCIELQLFRKTDDE
jgi:hypothetical protein